MATKPVYPRAKALEDTEEALHYYLENASARVAHGFIDALERAYIHISRHPATGSLQYAFELNIPGLRIWPLTRYPYLVCYVELAHQIEVWRLLHQERDIPSGLGLSN